MSIPTLLRVDACRVSVLALALVAIMIPFIFAMNSLPHESSSSITVNVLLPQVLVVQRYTPHCVLRKPMIASAVHLVNQCSILVMMLLSIAICNFISLAIDRGYIALEIVFIGKVKALILRFVASLAYTTCIAAASSYVLSTTFSILTGLSEPLSLKVIVTHFELSALLITLLSFDICIYLKRFSESLVTSVLAIIVLYAFTLISPRYSPFLSVYETSFTYIVLIAVLLAVLVLGVKRFEI